MKVELSTKVAFVLMPSSLAQNLSFPTVSSAVRMYVIAIRLRTIADFESAIRWLFLFARPTQRDGSFQMESQSSLLVSKHRLRLFIKEF